MSKAMLNIVNLDCVTCVQFMDNLIEVFSLKFHLLETPPFVLKLVGVQLQICVDTDLDYPHHQILQGVCYLLVVKFDR